MTTEYVKLTFNRIPKDERSPVFDGTTSAQSWVSCRQNKNLVINFITSPLHFQALFFRS